MKTAVIDGLIGRSPCLGIDLPRQTSHEEMKVLDPEQIAALADAIEPRLAERRLADWRRRGKRG